MHAATRYAEVLEVAEREGVDGPVRLADGRALVPELQVLERMLLGLAKQAPGNAAQAAGHLLAAGGKRLRPMLLFLCARAFGREPARLAELAAVAELSHSATLLHDDVIDMGEERRHQPAARLIWGNAVSVLAGDFLLVQALRVAGESVLPASQGALLQVMERMVAAEIHQLALRGQTTAREQDYWEVVDGKTASLFEWCAQMGALAGGATAAQAESAARFARELGVAFQVVDDLIDFEGDPSVAGKSVLRDLAEGKLTLPVLRALELRPELRAQVAACDAPESLGKALQATGAGASVRAEVDARLERALAALHELPESPVRAALAALSHAAVRRSA
jgi:octaprenyl-diphosphate synthase